MLYFRDWTLLLCFFRVVPEPGSLDPFLPKWMNEERVFLGTSYFLMCGLRPYKV